MPKPSSVKSDPYSLPRLMRRFLPFFRPYLKKYAVAVSLLLATIGLSLLPPFLLKLLIDDGIKLGNTHTLNLVVVYLVIALLVTGILRGVMDYIHEWVSAWLIYDLRSAVFTKIQEQSLDFFASRKTGDILSRLRTDVIAVYSVLVNTFLAGLSEVVQIVGTLAFMFYLNYKLAIMALAFTPFLYVILTVTGKRIRKLSLVLRDKDAQLLEFFHEIISNISIVKLYAREEYTMHAHSRTSKDVIDAGLMRLRYKFVSIFLIGTFTGLAPILFIWYGGYQVIHGVFSFGSFIAFYLYAARFYSPIQSITNRGVEIYNGLASAQRIAEYLDLRSNVAEAAHPIHLDGVRGEITFEQVSFRYPEAKTEALRDFDLRIEPGEKLAVVGPSGAGKTTIINLLCRLYDPQSGRVLVDGHDLRSLSFKSLRESIGVVSQEALLFHDTILENIRFGRPDATDSEIISAAKAAHLHVFIESLPSGYDTTIGTKGMKLSGGQRQRLSLARVILKNAKIWVLDEFTSSLDSGTESVIYENIAPLLRDKTAITIAHRLSTVVSADRIIVLEQGHLQESGTHWSLFQSNGLYATLFEAQMQASQPMYQEASATLG